MKSERGGKKPKGWDCDRWKEMSKREEDGCLKIGFWNVAGINNKDENFWNHIIKYDVII